MKLTQIQYQHYTISPINSIPQPQKKNEKGNTRKQKVPHHLVFVKEAIQNSRFLPARHSQPRHNPTEQKGCQRVESATTCDM